jgi:hypothetical protein
MRATLTLDPEVERLIEEEVHRVRRPFKQVVNDAIGRGLAPRLAEAVEPYRVKAHKAVLGPGIDSSALNRLADEIEDEAVVAKRRRPR